MKKAPLEAGLKARNKSSDKQYKRSLPVLQISPGVVELPVENLRRRPMRAKERSFVVCTWWAIRREGVRLPAERGVILIEGGRA